MRESASAASASARPPPGLGSGDAEEAEPRAPKGARARREVPPTAAEAPQAPAPASRMEEATPHLPGRSVPASSPRAACARPAAPSAPPMAAASLPGSCIAAPSRVAAPGGGASAERPDRSTSCVSRHRAGWKRPTRSPAPGRAAAVTDAPRRALDFGAPACDDVPGRIRIAHAVITCGWPAATSWPCKSSCKSGSANLGPATGILVRSESPHQ